MRLFARLTKFKAQICYCYDHFVQVSKTAVKIIYIPIFTHLRLKTSEWSCKHYSTEQWHPMTCFLLNTLKTLFRLSTVLLDLKKYIVSGRRYKIWICSAILGELFISLFEIIRTWILFSLKFYCNLTDYESETFSDSSLHHIFES